MLTDEENLGLEQFVQRKVEMSKEHREVIWDEQEAKTRLQDVLL